MRIDLYIPTKDRGGKELPAELVQAVRESARAELADICGGCSDLSGQGDHCSLGVWIPPSGKAAVEAVYILVAETTKDRQRIEQRIRHLAERVRDSLGQECVAVAFSPSRFYLW